MGDNVCVDLEPPAVFKGWYARARITVTQDGPYPLAGWYVAPNQGPQVNNALGGGTWAGTANPYFPGGVPYYVFEDGTQSRAIIYFCDPASYDATQLDLRHQYPFGTGSKLGTLSWQLWDQEDFGSDLAPYAGESGGTPFWIGSLFPQNWYFNL